VADIDTLYKAVEKRGVPIDYGLMRAKDVPMRSFSIRDGEGAILSNFLASGLSVVWLRD